MDNLFEKMTDYMCNSWLDKDIVDNEEYLKADEEVNIMMARLDEARLTKDVKALIHDCVDSYVELMTLHVNLAYRQGMKDLAAFIAGLYNVNLEK